ncbi:MAG: hypothetical protein J7545_23220 [Roseofilum sp. SBFL]|uniref:hypothetical protein n=1 Tax=unclassified Roseofilum TaxID=2620099 RepID=UPI001AFDED6C|nr:MULTISPECIES: hypothetical protein [unclassified Roseofilum]MBP0015280.1 hypothetical protein [Roseofilum sp. SID3]MBP0024318.1 hypothetical protein [Roseofilum sp. SID2]MBP0036266.1 hypothetical protein [Roseofilum sp. SID1]MBP0044848.1 hypothetical protein [Roseofilum sp. SBFL]
MKPFSPLDPVLSRFLSKMPTHIAVTFSEEQLDEIRKQLGDRQWQVHPLDLRLSFPIFNRCFYLVILAGQERRHDKRSNSPQGEWGIPLNFNTISNLLACVTFILILIPALLGLSYLYASVESEQNQAPSAIEESIDRILSDWGL